MIHILVFAGNSLLRRRRGPITEASSGPLTSARETSRRPVSLPWPGCVDVGVREDSAKDGTHPLELDAGAASLFLGGVTDYLQNGASSLRAREGPAHVLKGQRRRTVAETAGFVQTLRQPRRRSVGRVCAADEGLETKRALYSSSAAFPWQRYNGCTGIRDSFCAFLY